MGYVLFWAEGLAAALLCLALAARWAVARPSWLRAGWVTLVFLSFLVLAGAAVFCSGALLNDLAGVTGVSATPFFFSLGWLAAFLVASIAVGRRAFRRPAPGLAREGAGWPRRTLWLSLGGVALAFGLTFWNLDLAARADLTAARQEAGDLLLAMTPSPAAGEGNPARWYLEAGKDLITPVPNPWRDAALGRRPGQPRTEADWKAPAIVELIEKQEKVLSLVRKAASLPPCSLQRGSVHDFAAWTTGHELAVLRRNEMALLAIDARVKAAQGKLGRAFEDVAAILGFGRHLLGMMSAPEALASQFTAWQTLEDVLRLAPAGKGPLPAASFPEVTPPLRVVHQELAVFGMLWPAVFSDSPLRIFEIRKDAGPWGTPPLSFVTETLVTPAARVFLTPGELAYSHRKWEEYRRVLRGPAEGTPQDWASLRKLVYEGETGLFSALYVKPKELTLLREGGQLAALSRLAAAGLAVARYGDEHGKSPERLEQLVPDFLPAMPVDPRDGQALRMKHFPEVTVLYTAADSPGADTERTWDAEKHRAEPVFRLPPRGKAR